MDPNPIPSSPLLSGQESLSRASSMCSRKDSGIRSNSRRSSIQQQVYLYYNRNNNNRNYIKIFFNTILLTAVNMFPFSCS